MKLEQNNPWLKHETTKLLHSASFHSLNLPHILLLSKPEDILASSGNVVQLLLVLTHPSSDHLHKISIARHLGTFMLSENPPDSI